MTSPFGRLSLIVNPRAGGRRAATGVERLLRALDSQGLEYEVCPTSGPGDATGIARRRLAEGETFLVAVGGDGTVQEVANGMLDSDGRLMSPVAVLGVVGAGSGCDYIRTFDLPSRPAAIAARLGDAAVERVDVARIDHADGQGQPTARHFVNIAEAGLGATTAARAAGLPRFLGQSRYLVAFWAVLPSYRPGTITIDVDGRRAYEGRAVNVVAANCRYFGGGMQISPRSRPTDGSLELLVFNGRKTDSFTMLPKVYRGKHVPHRNIVELSGRSFRIESEEPLTIEADGEVLGSTAATVEVVPSALVLKV